MVLDQKFACNLLPGDCCVVGSDNKALLTVCSVVAEPDTRLLGWSGELRIHVTALTVYPIRIASYELSARYVITVVPRE